MRTLDQANAFAQHWILAWNARDLNTIVSHYTDDVVFYSPRIEVTTGRAVSFVSGKAALKAYWTEAVGRAPDLKFTLENVYLGRDALTIAYRNHRGQHVAETLVFNEQGLAFMSVAAYR